MSLNTPPTRPSPLPAVSPLPTPEAGTTQTPATYGRPGSPGQGVELPVPLTQAPAAAAPAPTTAATVSPPEG